MVSAWHEAAEPRGAGDPSAAHDAEGGGPGGAVPEVWGEHPVGGARPKGFLPAAGHHPGAVPLVPVPRGRAGRGIHFIFHAHTRARTHARMHIYPHTHV